MKKINTSWINGISTRFPIILTLALVIVMLVRMSVSPASEKPTPKDDENVYQVFVTSPLSKKWPLSVSAAGWFTPWHEAVISSRSEGLMIKTIRGDVGDTVRKGQVLAILDTDTLRAGLQRFEAALASAKSEYAMAAANANRARSMKGTGAQAVKQFDEAVYAEKSASASLAMAEANVKEQRIRLEHTKITAVDAGIISSRTAALGSVVAIGTELFRLIRKDKIEWQGEVDARWIASISKGQSVFITLVGGKTIKGRVRALSPSANKNSARAVVYVEMPPGLTPLSGMYASGYIVVETTQALTVPESALVYRDGVNYVFRVEADCRVSRVRVETGRHHDNRVEVLKGLEPNVNVVESGGAFLSDGLTVKVVRRVKEGV